MILDRHRRCGAVICFSDNYGGAGHVAIVEEILEDGTIRCSNSAWRSTYFWISTIRKIDNKYNWSHYTCQGFIYNPFADQPVPPPPPPVTILKKHKFPWAVLTNKIKRNRRTFF